MRYKIFISHSSEDKEIANSLVSIINDIFHYDVEIFCSSSIYIGEMILYGQDVYQTIRKKINESNIIITLLTPRSIKNIWVAYEFGFAECCSKEIIPLSFGMDFNNIPNSFYKYKQIVKSNKIDFKNFLNYLIEKIKVKSINLQKIDESVNLIFETLLTENNNNCLFLGKWQGFYRQKFKNKMKNFPLSIEFVKENSEIKCILFEKDDNSLSDSKLLFLNEYTVKITYKFSEKRFGEVFLSIEKDKSSLSGYFCGYGSFSNKSVGGSVNLKKR